MRMWLVPTNTLCRKHLLGEHVETHMLASCIKLSKSIKGFIANKLIQTKDLITRHEDLSQEMLSRGYKHNSPIPNEDYGDYGSVDIEANKLELISRCEECRKRAIK